MDDEIVLSDELWNYYVAVEQICTRIQQAYALALMGKDMATDESIYYGNASAELNFFMEALGDHLHKLLILYNVALTYLNNTFQEVCDVNKLLAWTIDHMLTI